MWRTDAITFLEELEENNDREWFRANRARYESAVREPALALGERLRDIGRPKVFRPFNDVRFHGGPPIKEHVGLVLGWEGGFAAGYVELSLDGLRLAAGLYQPKADQVERLRRAIDTGRIAARLTRAIAVAQASGMALNPPALKRGPRGYPADHPRAALLRHRSVTVSRVDEIGPWLFEDRAVARIREALEAAQPLVRWLGAHVGPSSAGAPPGGS